MKTTLVIDFDSTFVQVESLDELARIALRSAKDGRERLRQIEALTAAGMEGKIEFGESLAQRLGLFGARQEHIDEVVRLLKGKVTPSVARHRDWIREHAQQIYVISGGFHECIEPVVAEFGIATEHVLANRFVTRGGVVAGCEADNYLAQNDGKTKQLRALNFAGRVIMVGDGWSDYLTRLEHACDLFVAFTENVERPAVVAGADVVVKDFGKVIRLCSDEKVLIPKGTN